jgi:hypothetical protein
VRFSTVTLLGWIMVSSVVALAVTCPTSEASPWNSVTLNWTAPGDDGTVGTAEQYDIRYSTSAISGTDTTGWWNQATRCNGEPAPQGSGASESFVVTGLQPSTTYHFMIRTADEVPNWSGFSNLAVIGTADAPDSIPPAAVRDLAFWGENGHFLLVLSQPSVSVALETQGRASRAPGERYRRRDWPIVFHASRDVARIDGGLLT